MPRVFLIAILTAVIVVPATAAGNSSVNLRGTVSAKDRATHLVSVKATKRVVTLRVPGSLAAIRVGQRVELRGSILRAQRRGSGVLARGVSIAASRPLAVGTTSSGDDGADDDELEIKGTLTSLAPVTVASSSRTASCTAPAGMSLDGLEIGDLVEMTCDLVGGSWVVRKLEQEDDVANAPRADDDDDDDDDDHSGPGSGDDDDDDDSSGPGSGDDDHEDDH